MKRKNKNKDIDELRQRVKEIECGMEGGHKMVFVDGIYSNPRNKRLLVVKKCRLCGHIAEMYISEDEEDMLRKLNYL